DPPTPQISTLSLHDALPISLMVIPSRPVSIATARIIPSIAALAAPYAAEPGLLTSGPVTEVIFTMRPYFRAVIPGRTARVIRNRSEEHTSELQSRGHLVCRL